MKKKALTQPKFGGKNAIVKKFAIYPIIYKI